MDLGKLLTLVETLGLNKEQVFELIEEESRKEREKSDAEIARLDREIAKLDREREELKRCLEEKRRQESVEPAAREVEGTRCADSGDAESKIEETEKCFPRQIAEVKGAFEARDNEHAERDPTAGQLPGEARTLNTPVEGRVLPLSTCGEPSGLPVFFERPVVEKKSAPPYIGVNSTGLEGLRSCASENPVGIDGSLFSEKSSTNSPDSQADSLVSEFVKGDLGAEPSAELSDNLGQRPQTTFCFRSRAPTSGT